MIYFAQSLEGGPVKIGHSDDVHGRIRQLEAHYERPLAVLATMDGGRDDLVGFIVAEARLAYGRFLLWLKAEFGWSVQTAENLMHVAEAFKFTTVVNFPIGQKALYALASPSVPEAARAHDERGGEES